MINIADLQAYDAEYLLKALKPALRKATRAPTPWTPEQKIEIGWLWYHIKDLEEAQKGTHAKAQEPSD